MKNLFYDLEMFLNNTGTGDDNIFVVQDINGYMMFVLRIA